MHDVDIYGYDQRFHGIFMHEFSVHGSNFKNCLDTLSKVLARCEEKNLVLNWEKCHFMVNDGIVLGHKVSAAGIEVDRAKIEVMNVLPAPTTVKDSTGDLSKILARSPDLSQPSYAKRLNLTSHKNV